MHRVHTLNPGCGHATPWAGCIMAHQAPCRGHVAAYSRPYHALCHARRVAALPLALLCVMSQPSWPCRAPLGRIVAQYRLLARPYRKAVLWPVSDTPSSQAALLSRYAYSYRDTIPSGQASLLSRYKRLYHETPHQPGRALAHGRPCQGLSRSYRKPSPAISQGLATRPCAPLPLPVTIQYIVS